MITRPVHPNCSFEWNQSNCVAGSESTMVQIGCRWLWNCGYLMRIYWIGEASRYRWKPKPSVSTKGGINSPRRSRGTWQRPPPKKKKKETNKNKKIQSVFLRHSFFLFWFFLFEFSLLMWSTADKSGMPMVQHLLFVPPRIYRTNLALTDNWKQELCWKNSEEHFDVFIGRIATFHRVDSLGRSWERKRQHSGTP